MRLPILLNVVWRGRPRPRLLTLVFVCPLSDLCNILRDLTFTIHGVHRNAELTPSRGRGRPALHLELGINPQPAVIFGLLNQTSPYWILADVLALQLQALV